MWLLLFALVAAQAAPAGGSPRLGQPVADSQLVPQTTLTLPEAIARARRASPLRQAGEQRVRSARMARSLVHRAPNPSVDVRAENWGAGVPAHSRDTFAVVTQTIELGGKASSRRLEASTYDALASATLSATDWELAREVAERYLATLHARETRGLLASHEASLAELVRVLTDRVDEGATAEADLRRLETERVRARVAVSRADITLAHELGLLSALVDERVDARTLVTPDLPATPPDGPAFEAGRLDVRPDVRAARAGATHWQSMARLERAAAVPDLAISAGYKGTGGLRTGVAAIGFDVPLFQRNRVAIARAAGEARAAELEAEYIVQRAQVTAEAEWMTARLLIQEAAALDDALLNPASVVRTAARAAFVEGSGDILRLVDAERGYADAARDALDLRLDAIRAYMRARLALGEEPLP